ncbi:hypothetical protein HOLleu_39685 [Holothuria leucospilota]|uniref:Uncharacterized protein n=1 Tax=Holothuria leucospilota TaxID=206669 RepID=A0A9Q1BA09_HOLLE|nr:hypothetical protein HOLleu_39685 [Holothuria leucospilota]
MMQFQFTLFSAQRQKRGRPKQSKGQNEVTSWQQNKPLGNKYNCGRCGRKHGLKECPAIGTILVKRQVKRGTRSNFTHLGDELSPLDPPQEDVPHA